MISYFRPSSSSPTISFLQKGVVLGFEEPKELDCTLVEYFVPPQTLPTLFYFDEHLKYPICFLRENANVFVVVGMSTHVADAARSKQVRFWDQLVDVDNGIEMAKRLIHVRGDFKSDNE
jgi:hypothetical protein